VELADFCQAPDDEPLAVGEALVVRLQIPLDVSRRTWESRHCLQFSRLDDMTDA
jgi:hypothetical protein